MLSLPWSRGGSPGGPEAAARPGVFTASILETFMDMSGHWPCRPARSHLFARAGVNCHFYLLLLFHDPFASSSRTIASRYRLPNHMLDRAKLAQGQQIGSVISELRSLSKRRQFRRSLLIKVARLHFNPSSEKGLLGPHRLQLHTVGLGLSPVWVGSVV